MHQIHFRTLCGSSRRFPRSLVGWGGGYPIPILHSIDAYGVSIWAPRLEPLLHARPAWPLSVDHSLLLLRLQRKFGLVDTVLRWFTSFICGRTQQISFDGHLSSVMKVLYGVPQGSVLGPLLFAMYTTNLSRVVTQQSRHFPYTSTLTVTTVNSILRRLSMTRRNLGRPIRSLYWRGECLHGWAPAGYAWIFPRLKSTRRFMTQLRRILSMTVSSSLTPAPAVAGYDRSADIDTCCVPRNNTRFGDRSFAAAGPRLWNSLPARIRQPDNDIGEFRRQLKPFLFMWHCGAWLSAFMPLINTLTDSLTHAATLTTVM